MRIQHIVTIDAPVDKVWDIVGNRYGEVGNWARTVDRSTAKMGQTPGGAACTGRTCATTLGDFSEDIVRFDPAKHELAYTATGDKMPGFVRSLQGDWQLEPIGPNRTKVRMELTADIAPPFNILMGWMMKMQFNKAISATLEDLKIYAETGRVSDGKRKAAAKAGVPIPA